MKLKEGCIFQEKTLKYFLINKPGVPIVINLFGIEQQRYPIGQM